ncbi:hypothetical protein Nmel_018178, partial [Mimus melanotis]
ADLVRRDRAARRALGLSARPGAPRSLHRVLRARPRTQRALWEPQGRPDPFPKRCRGLPVPSAPREGGWLCPGVRSSACAGAEGPRSQGRGLRPSRRWLYFTYINIAVPVGWVPFAGLWEAKRSFLREQNRRDVAAAVYMAV